MEGKMDTYLEYIIKQKYSLKAVLISLGAYILAGILSFITFSMMFLHPLILRFSLPLAIAYFIGAWWITQRFNIEYEYIVTNDELDVDKIMSKKTRKRMLTISVKNFDMFGKAEGEEFEKVLNDNEIVIKFDASAGKNSERRYFAVFNNKQEQKMLLVFNPTTKMLEAFRRYNPSKVILDD